MMYLKVVPSTVDSPKSMMSTMFGWLISFTALASLKKRVTTGIREISFPGTASATVGSGNDRQEGIGRQTSNAARTHESARNYRNSMRPAELSGTFSFAHI